MKARKIACVGAVLAVAAATIPAVEAQDSPVRPYRQNDRSVVALNIVPPGQGRYMNGPELAAAQGGGAQPVHNTDQIALYDSLVQGAPDVTSKTLNDYFKDASLGVPADKIERQYEPRAGVVVVRDSDYGVPHVYGDTREDVMFGAGYVSGEDRLFMMDTLRFAGRGRLSEFLGASPANLAMDKAAYLAAGYEEDELGAMLDRVEQLYPRIGATARADVNAYADGVNQFISEARIDPTKMPGEYEALQVTPDDWTPNDTVAVATLIGSSLGVGGGSELNNAAFLEALQTAGFSSKKATKILRDFRFSDDPEAPTTTDKRFPWMTDLGPVNKKSVAVPDSAADLQRQMRAATPPDHIDGPFGPIRLAFPSAASNALLVGADLSKTKRPIAVFGPQTGYWSPQILMEMGLYGPGIETRGVGFPGISLYTLLGRGRDYAWSATSAGGDLTDTYAEKLCEPDGEPTIDSTFYVDGGECLEMYTRTDTWAAKPTAGGVPDPGAESVMISMTTQRTDDGIVQARGTVKGKPVAFVAKRSSFGAEVDSAVTYVEMSDPAKINNAKDFQKAFGKFSFTFNWFYVDDKDIAFQLGGYHPRRPKGVDPDLPTWGTRKWGWKGMLSFKDTPKDQSPRKGFITSWNNKQAPGFRANDGQYSYGPVYRVQPLDDGILKLKKKGKKIGLADLVNIMGSAATVDLRGYAVLPIMLKALRKPTNHPKPLTAYRLLNKWRKAGAHRRDKDLDGAYEHSSAIALMDAWWAKAAEAIFKPTLKEAWDARPFGLDNEPGPVGSAYQSGVYSHIQKDLRTVMGRRVKGKLSRIYCGGGSRKACRVALRASLDAAIAELEAAFGEDPAAWDADEDADKIQYTALGVQGQVAMQWQNRPTFQQVVEFK